MRIIGTSGSTDYLRDGTAAKRFWCPYPEVPPVGEIPTALRTLAKEGDLVVSAKSRAEPSEID